MKMEGSGGRPKKETIGLEKEKTIGFQNTKTKTKPNENVNENVNDNVNENVNDNVVGDSCVDGLQEVLKFYDNNIGMLTPFIVETLTYYSQEMDYEVLIFAMEKAVASNIRTLAYIKGTLNNWSKKGIKTLLQAKEENQSFKNKGQEVKEETEKEKLERRAKELEEMINANK